MAWRGSDGKLNIDDPGGTPNHLVGEAAVEHLAARLPTTNDNSKAWLQEIGPTGRR